MEKENQKRICSVDGCFKKHDSLGFCGMHRYRFLKYGDPMHVERERNHNPPGKCTIDGCENKHMSKGFCRKHYLKNYRNGDPLHQEREMLGMSMWPENKIWRGMKTRCSDFSNKNYGGKGIIVCDRWLHSFNNFISDMGRRPSKIHQIDRKDSDKNYTPDNCRWVLPVINSRNRKIVKLSIEKAREIRRLYKTGNYTMTKIAEKYGVVRHTISSVIHNEIWKESES